MARKRTRPRAGAARSGAIAAATEMPPTLPMPSGDNNPVHDPLQVISELEAARLLNLSVDTLRRRVRAGDGPPRIALSERRVGYRRGALAAWMDQRT